MGFTTPLYIPLTKGLEQSKGSALGSDELHIAENVDYAIDGVVQGRPGRAEPLDFVELSSSTPFGTNPTYASPAPFNETGYVSAGLVAVNSALSSRPALATQGRLFINDDERWLDHGPFACATTRRVARGRGGLFTEDPRSAMGPDFIAARYDLASPAAPIWSLLDENYEPGLEDKTSGGSQFDPGGSARCGTTTALVSVYGTGNTLKLFTRTAGADTLTEHALAADAANTDQDGDAPSLCSSHDAETFWVLYQTTTANELELMRVATDGTIEGSFTIDSAITGGLTGVHGHWVDNSPDSGGVRQIVVAITHDDGVCVLTLQDDGSSITDSGRIDFDLTGTQCLDVTVGVQDISNAYLTVKKAAVVTEGDLVIMHYNLNTTLTSMRTLVGDHTGIPLAGVRWAAAHQAILIQDRMYLTVIASVADTFTGTWTTLDLTNWHVAALSGPGPFDYPTLVAQGPVEGTEPHAQPVSAVEHADGSGWVFATNDFVRFALDTSLNIQGFDLTAGLNEVTFTGTREAHTGTITVFSGSIPHMTSQGQTCEFGFPFMGGIPGIAVEAVGGGAVGVGDYGIVACWRWTDPAGNIHRSGTTAIRTVPVSAGLNTIQAYVTNPWLTERPAGTAYIELYSTDVDSTADGDHFLQTTVAANFADGFTTITLTTQPVTDTEPVYTDGGVYVNISLPADGGVTTLGRRLWMASGSTAYASKYLAPGVAPGFNDQGALQVNLPAGAGRIVALETLDDKLVILCTKGVYLVTDGGPNNIGEGSDFGEPLAISQVSIAGPRSSASTDQGVLFCAALDPLDPTRGGPWLLDRQLTLSSRSWMGRSALKYFQDTLDEGWIPEVTFSPERQQAYITVPEAEDDALPATPAYVSASSHYIVDEAAIAGTAGNDYSVQFINDGATSAGTWVDGENAVYHLQLGTTTVEQFIAAAAGSAFHVVTGWLSPTITTYNLNNGRDASPRGSSGVVMLDMRSGRWATWGHNNQPIPIGGHFDPAGVLGAGDVSSIVCVNGILWTLGDEPAPYNEPPGDDAIADYQMRIATSHLASSGTGLGWSRVRSVRPQPHPDAGAHELTLEVVMDQTRTFTSDAFTVAAPSADTVWPGSIQAPEWRLPTQKCTSIQVVMMATPATAKWSAIRLDVQPLPPVAPAGNRS